MNISIPASSQTCQFCFVNDIFYCVIFKIIKTLSFNANRASVDHLFGTGKAIGTFEKWAPGFKKIASYVWARKTIVLFAFGFCKYTYLQNEYSSSTSIHCLHVENPFPPMCVCALPRASGLLAVKWVAGTLTWDQALFSFRFENCIPPGKAERKESLMQTLYETCTAHVFEWLTFGESANQNYFRCFFF